MLYVYLAGTPVQVKASFCVGRYGQDKYRQKPNTCSDFMRDLSVILAL